MGNDVINYEDGAVIATLRQTVAQGATDAEFAMFTQFCRSTGLNPFKKEIWFIKTGGRVQMMTGINGFLAIANSHPQFDGMEVDVEVTQQGQPLKATCKVYRKDRRFPSVGVALMSEFRKETPIWKQMPSVMLTKVAKSIAIREAFPQELNGLYTEEEMPREYVAPRPLEAVAVPQPVVGEWYYKTADIEDPKRSELECWLSEHGIEQVGAGIWRAPKELKKLAELRIDKPTDALEEKAA